MNWDDLKVAIAVHRSGSYAAAAARLRVDETTVARRISRLQRDLGIVLFDAVDGGRQATEAGAKVLKQALEMAGPAEEIETHGAAIETAAKTFRIATTDSIAVRVLSPRVTALLNEFPGLKIEFLASTENVNFSRWEADAAIRLHKPERGDFLVSRIAAIRLYLICPRVHDGAETPMLYAYPEELDASPESRFLQAADLNSTVRCITKNLLVAEQLIRSGQCGGVLPGFMCADLRENPHFEVTELPEPRNVWLLLQPHLKDDPMTRTIVSWIKTVLKEATSR